MYFIVELAAQLFPSKWSPGTTRNETMCLRSNWESHVTSHSADVTSNIEKEDRRRSGKEMGEKIAEKDGKTDEI